MDSASTRYKEKNKAKGICVNCGKRKGALRTKGILKGTRRIRCKACLLKEAKGDERRRKLRKKLERKLKRLEAQK